jgi:tetratricopeptide (TPR) repeat protein
MLPRFARLAAFLPGLLVPAALAFLSPATLAQEPPPARPRLSAGADTNSAAAYYFLGLDRLRADQFEVAATAFYWASRLAPDWADALYGRRVALLLTRPDRLVAYMEDVESVVESPEMRHLDSLYYQALLLDPFLYTDLEYLVIMHYVTERELAELRRQSLRIDELARSQVEDRVRLYLRTPAAAGWRAWLAYAERRMDDAVTLYAEALKRARNDEHRYRTRLHLQRARSFYLANRRDSAVAELGRAIEENRRRDERVLAPLYESKALLEHTLGVALESNDDLTGARAAYGRALVEDLAFYPAHVRLGGLLAAAGDTAGARAEYELALEVAPEAPVVRIVLANHHHGSGDHRAALTTLEPLLESEPYWAEPYLLRALALDRLGDREGAAAQYGKFLEHTEAADDRRDAAARRLAALGSP